MAFVTVTFMQASSGYIYYDVKTAMLSFLPHGKYTILVLTSNTGTKFRQGQPCWGVK